MQIYDQLGFKTEFTSALDKEGRDFLLLVIKGTFDFPEHLDDELVISENQAELVFADEATGEPGFSATLWERYWTSIGFKFISSKTSSFRRQPITYDVAFGGVDRLNKEDEAPPSYPQNPMGTGWASNANSSLVPGLRLPNTQAPNETVSSPFAEYTPKSLGPMGRGWPGRIEYGGTYDQAWIDDVFPFLPADFDDRYYQMAPPDQQVSELNGGDEVILANLTPRGKENFRLPDTSLPVKIFKGRDAVFDGNLKPDTLLFAPEERKFSLVWRVSLPIKRIITEFTEAWVGPPTDAMLRARREGRTYIRAVSTLPTEDALE